MVKVDALKGEDILVRTQHIEDRLALKELVDNVSRLTAERNMLLQVAYFTDYATLETYAPGNRVVILNGSDEIRNALGRFLTLFETVYQLNGQHVVNVSGDRATGILYCTVTIVGGYYCKRVKFTMNISYDDLYVRDGATWLIERRKMTVHYREAVELASGKFIKL